MGSERAARRVQHSEGRRGGDIDGRQQRVLLKELFSISPYSLEAFH
jgi:hypothetical protein